MLGLGFTVLLCLLLLAFPETELIVGHILGRLLLFLVIKKGTSIFSLRPFFWLLFLSLYLSELSRFLRFESFALPTFFLVGAFELGRRFRRAFRRLDLSGITMRCLDMSVANRKGLADLLSVVCVLLWLLLSNCSFKLPIVFKVLLLLPLLLIRIMVSLLDVVFMVFMVFTVAMCRVTMFIASESSPMKQVLLHIDIGVKVRSIT